MMDLRADEGRIVDITRWEAVTGASHFACSRCGKIVGSASTWGVRYRRDDDSRFVFLVGTECARELDREGRIDEDGELPPAGGWFG